MKTQTALVLKHLQEAGSISNVEAHAVHNIRSVSSRISELRKMGIPITKEHKHDITGQRYVRYTLGLEA